MKVGIVLSGGGAKGAYQIGFWKAIRKLNIKYDIVTGTSVGAINGAMMVQNTYKKAYKLWNNLSYEMILGVKIENLSKKDIIKTYGKQILKGGFEIPALESLVHSSISNKKIYKSKVDFGMVTVKINRLDPLELSKKDIPKNKFSDYIIASASCYPAFQKKKIDDDYYIDGGIYENLPINLALKLGADKIIAVDLNDFNITKKIKNDKVPITYIKLKNNGQIFLDFNKEMSKELIKIGYNDTMKAFDKLEGNLYTFKKNHLNKEYDRFIKKTNIKYSYNNFCKLIEDIGFLLDIDQTKIYSLRKYNRIIKYRYKSNKVLSSNYKKVNKINKLNKYYYMTIYIKYLENMIY